MMGLKKKIIIIVIVICALFFGSSYWEYRQKKKSEPRIEYSNVYTDKIEKLSELALIGTTYNGVAEVKNKWIIDCLDEIALMEYKAEVKVGVKFSKDNIKVNDDKKIINIKLPSAEVIDVNVIKSSIKWDYVSWNKLEGKDYTKEGIKQAEDECRKKVKEMNLIELANKKAKILVENLYSGFKECDDPYKVNVTIDESDSK